VLQPAIRVMPEQIQVSDEAGGAKTEALVLVQNNSRTPITLTEAMVNASDVTVQTVEATPGKFFNLKSPSRQNSCCALIIRWNCHSKDLRIRNIPSFDSPSFRPLPLAPARLQSSKAASDLASLGQDFLFPGRVSRLSWRP